MERVVVLRSEDPLAFVAGACDALAGAVNRVRAISTSEGDLVDTYAELVVAYSRLVRRDLAGNPAHTARLNIVDHLVDRLRQARAGEITLPVLDVVDRLHAEITREPAGL